MEADDVVPILVIVAAKTLWSDPLVIVGIATAVLFILVLSVQIIATFGTIRAANAAKSSVDLAKAEAELRLAPFISVPEISAEAILDEGHRVLLRKNPQTGNLDANEARKRGEPKFIVYRIEIKNSGTIAAANMGHGLG